jgi:hypothetical protein
MVTPSPPSPSSSSPNESAAAYWPPKRRYNIAMCTDFFHPGFGGVESHTYALACCLLKRGHKVIIITRAQEERISDE